MKGPIMSIMKKYFVLWGSILVVLIVCGPIKLFAVDMEELQSALLQQLERRPAELLKLEGHGMDTASIDKALADIYHEEGLQPLWTNAKGPGERAEILIDVIRAAGTEGLNPEDYHLSKIEQYWKSTDAVGLARLDILLSLALGGYVADAREGRLNPRKVDPKLFAGARDVNIDPVELAEKALATPDLKKFLEQQVPTNERYRELRKILAGYRAIAAKGGWDPIPDGESLKPGMNDQRVPIIRERLWITKDLESDDFSSTLYDEKLSEAVKHFQKRYGLDADGVMGEGTRTAMNLPVETLVRTIEVNMERWRWMSRDLGDTRVAVTIAGFELGVFNNGQIELIMPVIVGKLYHQTPVFSNEIEYIEINPYWNIPTSIAANEMLPKLKQNPSYLKERDIRVFASWSPDAKELDSTSLDWHSVGRDIVHYKLRQDPGPKNALGTVKFVFPNNFNVYLHDTPSHTLFERSQRTFSHGCIRVSRPAELASHLLGGKEKGWGLDRVQEIIESGKRTVVPLEKPIPIHITYRTVWIHPDGSVHFSPDIYGRDKLLQEALY
jgi:murein L,D-transpeptidase YcbB/YkuD